MKLEHTHAYEGKMDTHHKSHVEHMKQHEDGGHKHHTEHYKEHAAGHKLHHEHVAAMCGGGMAKRK